MSSADTIFALSTPAGKAGVAVVRMSGPASFQIANRLSPKAPLEIGKIQYCGFAASDGSLIDRGLRLAFEGPKSFTGEDCVEFHIHGGRAVIDKLLSALADQGMRPAEPGEFTRRAFENDKLDLTAAEGLADLIDAETEAQRRQAFVQMEGHLGKMYESWRASLIGAMALMEAEIDFADEDLPEDLSQQIYPAIAEVLEEIQAHLNDRGIGERLRDGVRIAILGPPNVGKSSLINALSQRDVAIVSDISGTTRDILEVHLDLGGIPVLIADTAGLRTSGDAIEAEGIRRAQRRAKESDLRCFVGDASQAQTFEDGEIQDLFQEGDLLILNKSDLKAPDVGPTGSEVISISVKTGDGLDRLIESLSDRVHDLAWPSEAPRITRQRHRLLLEEVVRHLKDLQAHQDREVALRAETLRLSVRSLGRITGRVDVEDVLDLVFSEFCIGK